MTHLFLAGARGTDTRTVGRLLADRLHLPYADGDEAMAAVAAQPIPGASAESDDAIECRRAAQVLQFWRTRPASLIVLDGAVLALPGTLALFRRAGPVICLSAGPAAIARRRQTEAGNPREKVAEPLAKIRDLLESRQTAFTPGDAQVDTTHLEPEEVAEQVLDWLHRVRVNLGERSYDIHIQEGCHAGLGPLLAQLPDAVSSVVLISNRDIDRAYGDVLRTSLTNVGLPHHTLLVPGGERYKSLETANRLFGDLLQRKVDRKAVIVALGGGVIGDLAGFVAGTYQRGLRFVQVPTSLLAQVDSSVGGKVGVNHPLGKNMIGVFLQPQMVLLDPRALATLPQREQRSGLAEVVKYGVIWDEEFFAYLEAHVEGILRQDLPAMKHIIRTACQIKAHVVEQDERESDLRAILNFGHTAAHAVETQTRYERYTHGEAVAIGMVIAARVAHLMGMLRAEPVQRLIHLLERFGLPTYLPKADPAVLISLMESDKKAVSGAIRFILPTKIGRVELVNTVPRDLLRRAIKESIEL